MITRSITRPVTSPIARSVTAAYGAWNPRALFALGEQGVIYDPNRLDTLFQDAAGTIPVTAAGQPVGRMLDMSGRGNHISFGDGATRPMLRFNVVSGYFYLAPDGADDFGVTLPIDFTGTGKVSLFMGVRKLSDAARAMVVELGSGVASAFRLEAPSAAASPNYVFTSHGSTAASAAYVNAAVAAPHSSVLSCAAAISLDTASIRVNGTQVAQSSGDQGSGNYGNHPLYLFRRGGTSLPFNGHFYGLTIVGRLCTDAETRNVERLYANKTGVVLV